MMGCLSIEGDVPEVRMTRHALTIQGMPSEEAGPVARTVTFSHPYDALQLPDEIQTELRPVSCTLAARDGVDDLSFLMGFSLVISSPASAAPAAQEVFAYSADESAPAGSTLTVAATSSPNVFEYWSTDATEYTLIVYGHLPEQEWTIDVAVDFRGKAKFEM